MIIAVEIKTIKWKSIHIQSLNTLQKNDKPKNLFGMDCIS